MATLSQDGVRRQKTQDMSFPIPTNIPMSFIKNSTFFPIFAPACTKWFMYDFKTQNMTKSALIKSIFKDPFTEYCPDIDGVVPYFRMPTKTINKDIYKAINALDQQKFVAGVDTGPN